MTKPLGLTVCCLGHSQRSYECPACAEALGHGEQTVEAWRWFRTRTSSKRIKAAIDEHLKRRGETANRDAQAPLPASVSATPEGSQRGRNGV